MPQTLVVSSLVHDPRINFYGYIRELRNIDFGEKYTFKKKDWIIDIWCMSTEMYVSIFKREYQQNGFKK